MGIEGATVSHKMYFCRGIRAFPRGHEAMESKHPWPILDTEGCELERASCILQFAHLVCNAAVWMDNDSRPLFHEETRGPTRVYGSDGESNHGDRANVEKDDKMLLDNDASTGIGSARLATSIRENGRQSISMHTTLTIESA